MTVPIISWDKIDRISTLKYEISEKNYCFTCAGAGIESCRECRSGKIRVTISDKKTKTEQENPYEILVRNLNPWESYRWRINPGEPTLDEINPLAPKATIYYNINNDLNKNYK